MNKNFFEHFVILDDPRCQCDVKYPLQDIVTLVICALLSGFQTFDDIVEYGLAKQDFLQATFGISNIPSKSTLSRVIAIIDPIQFGMACLNAMRQALGVEGEIIALDGKSIRSTHGKNKKNKLHLLTAYLVDNGVSLATLDVSEKTNEIPACQELLGLLDIKGKIITADALNTQKKTVQLIIQKGADYCLPVKDNHKHFYRELRFYLLDLILKGKKSEKTALEHASSTEKNRDRLEERDCWVLQDWEDFEAISEWKGVTSLVALRRRVTKLAVDESSEEWAIYISSLALPADRFLEITRKHWRIESMHWWLDVVAGEDKCLLQSDVGQRNLNHLRKLIFSLHYAYRDKNPKQKNMKKNQTRALLNDSVLLEIISV